MKKNLLGRARRVIRDAERGVSAVILALSMVVMLGAGAIGFDIATLAYVRQLVRGAVDAAAQVGAAQLSANITPATARSVIQTAFTNNYTLNYTGWGNYPKNLTLVTSDANTAGVQNYLKITFLCVVKKPVLAADPTIASEVSSVCGMSTYSATDVKCSAVACAVPCPDSGACNSASVAANVTVGYVFAPAININSGDTGAVTTLACACGDQAVNKPMNIVVMADRTPSMVPPYTTSDAFTKLQQGLKDMLLVMDRTQQYVAFGTIAISSPTSSCKTAEPSGGDAFSDATYNTSNSSGFNINNKLWTFKGSWVPVGFSNDYTTGTKAANNLTQNTSSTLYKSINCLAISDDSVNYPSPNDFTSGRTTYQQGYKTSSNEGTHLASALKGAANYLLSNVDANNHVTTGLDASGSRDSLGKPQNVIIFETDGQPSEIFNSDASANSLSDSHDIGSAGNGTQKSCDNFQNVANQVKAKGILLITIGYGSVNSASCGSSTVRKVLGDAATPPSSGTTETPLDCTVDGNTALENGDGDNYYCAADGDTLKQVFKTVAGSLGGGTKFMSIDGVGD